MSKTTVLFVCLDNSLLSPLAEAYFNDRAGGRMRAFSAGLAPAGALNRHVSRLLSASGVDASGLAPKPVDVFLMPHAEVPDRVIYLTDLARIVPPRQWKATTSSHWWSLAGSPPFAEGFGACAACFHQITKAIDDLVDPPQTTAGSVFWKVA